MNDSKRKDLILTRSSNWDPDKVHLILGPPGTGKTTALLNILDEKFKMHDPHDIMFVAFTRKAAHEAITRAMSRFGMDTDDLRYFRTLHSLAFRTLGLSSKIIMGVRDHLEVARSLGLSITLKALSEDGSFHGQTRGDRMFFMENIARVRGISLRAYWSENATEDIWWEELDRFERTYRAYKEDHGKLDYTDAITKFVSQGEPPDVRVVIVDEAQDLSPVQWQMVTRLCSNAGEVYIAGDDDQAIFRWAGADIEQFIEMEAGDVRVLEQSWRVPSKIAVCAERVIKQVKMRRSKEWKPREDEGVARFIGSLDQVDMSKGTWYLLGRNKYLLEQYERHCHRQGLVYTSPLNSPVNPATLKAIRSWTKLLRGEDVPISEAVNIYKMFTIKIGVKYGFKGKLAAEDGDRRIKVAELRSHFGLVVSTPWYEAFDRLNPAEREYLIAARKRGESFLDDPRIRINTIHGVKGGEADNVVLCSDMAARTFKEYEANPDDEHRVWYVAITRAKQSLFILYPTQSNSYPIDKVLSY